MLRTVAKSTLGAVGVCTRSCAPASRMLTYSAISLNKHSKDSTSEEDAKAVACTSQAEQTTNASSMSTKPLVRESSSSPEELNMLPLPYLSFALGVATPPSAAPSSWAETRDRLISPEHRMASRKAIVKEATRGYFHDFHAIRSHGGKTWRAPNTLIKDQRALWFPKIEGTRLSDKAKVNTVDMFTGKVSVVALLGSKLSEEHTKSFYEQTLKAYSTNATFQFVQINLQTNPLKSYLVSLFLSSLRTQIPASLHPTYVLSSQNIELVKDALGFHNKHVGYTYLIDPQGRIRWAGSAFAQEDEVKALKTCTGVLLDRVAEQTTSKKKK